MHPLRMTVEDKRTVLLDLILSTVKAAKALTQTGKPGGDGPATVQENHDEPSQRHEDENNYDNQENK